MSSIEKHGLPVDLESEKLILGSVLKNADKYFPIAADALGAADFGIDAHRRIWARIVELREAGEALDYVSVYGALVAREEASAVGGLGFLTSLTENLPEIVALETHVRRVKHASVKRRAVYAMQSHIDAVCRPDGDVETVEAAQRMLSALAAEAMPSRNLRSLNDIIMGEDGRARDFLYPEHSAGGIETPWAGLNHLLGGLRPGQLIILAARPAVGKSTAAASMAVHAAERGAGTVFVSLEMPSADIVRRLVAARANVPLTPWMRGQLAPAQRKAIANAAQGVRGLPLYLDDAAACTVPALEALILRRRQAVDVGLAVVDYLQLLTGPQSREHNRNNEVDALARGLKTLAMRLEIPVLALSQLSRESEKQGRRPRMSDLRDSGGIEQHANKVMFLHPVSDDRVELILDKNREGQTGTILLDFAKPSARFTEVSGDSRGE
jgi:replicative DNA helicase